MGKREIGVSPAAAVVVAAAASTAVLLQPRRCKSPFDQWQEGGGWGAFTAVESD